MLVSLFDGHQVGSASPVHAYLLGLTYESQVTRAQCRLIKQCVCCLVPVPILKADSIFTPKFDNIVSRNQLG